MRKFLKGVATAVMAAVLSVTCLGATSALADGYSKTVTFNGVKDGDTINVYKLGEYEGGSYNSFKFDDGFADFLRERQGAGHESDDSKALAEYLQSVNANQDNLRELMKSYANGWGTTVQGAPAVAATVSKTSGTEPSVTLEPGYYLVLPATTSANSVLYNPVVVSVRVSGDKSLISFNGRDGVESASVTVSMKTVDGPQIDKYVLRADTHTLRRTKTVGVGDVVTYVVKLTIPDYSTTGDPELTLKDTLKNLMYVHDSVAVYDDFAEGQGFSADHLIAGAVTGTYEPDYANGSQSVSFELDYGKLRGASAGTKTVYVAYQATVMSDIVTAPDANGRFAGSNVASLEYRTSPDAQTNSTTDSFTTSVYTYEFKLDKVDSNGANLNGAKFKFTSKKGDGAETELKFKQTQDGYYVISNDSDAVAELPANNEIVIRGLDPFNTYYVEETETPNGYYAPAGRFAVSMKSAMDSANSNEHSGNLSDDSAITAELAKNQMTDGSLVNSSVSDATLTMKLKNSTMPVLPSTGGMGTMLFTIGGVALMVVAAIAFMVIRKKGDQK